MRVGPATAVREAWEAASPENAEMIERIRSAHLDADLAGVDLLAQSPMACGLRGLILAVQVADDRMLCAAMRACTKGSGTLILLMQRVPDKPEILRTLMANEMWDEWGRAGGFVPAFGAGGEAAIAISVVRYLALPGGLERYQVLMERLLAQSAA
ncbi:hypothetical protein ACWCPF_43855 [Streptomyces sp. NPDC001858]